MELGTWMIYRKKTGIGCASSRVDGMPNQILLDNDFLLKLADLDLIDKFLALPYVRSNGVLLSWETLL